MDSLAAPDSGVRRVRRWRVPPPLTRGSELLEGGEVLTELPDEVGVLLWKALRNVMLWAASDTREPDDLFSPGAQRRRLAEIASATLDPALRRPLESLATVLGEAGGAQRDVVALACRRVAQWADAREATATALAFTQAAAVTCPHDARLAFAVGRLARQRAENARSESWFRRAIMLGRQNGDWETYALGYLGLGNLFFQRGNFPLARRAHFKGLRAARRKGLREIVGRAFHDLMAIEVESDNAARAQEYAAAALRAYGAGHPRLPALAHDTAALWASQGGFARALPVFQAVLPTLKRPHEHLVVLSSVARAAAGADQIPLFEEVWQQVWEASSTAGEGAGVAHALLHLAHGASLLGRWEQAEEAARRAARIATLRGEAQLRFETDALLDAIRSHRSLEAHLRDAATTSAPDEQADLLAAQLILGVRGKAVSV